MINIDRLPLGIRNSLAASVNVETARVKRRKLVENIMCYVYSCGQALKVASFVDERDKPREYPMKKKEISTSSYFLGLQSFMVSFQSIYATVLLYKDEEFLAIHAYNTLFLQEG